MKFFFGILLVALVAIANAQDLKELNPENAAPSADAVRNKRSYAYGTYTAPVYTAPRAVYRAPTVAYAAAPSVSYASYARSPSYGYSSYTPSYSGHYSGYSSGYPSSGYWY